MNYGKSEGFYRRQIATWSKQYESSKTPDTDSTAMEGLVTWLQANVPPESAPAVVHGDFRLDNLIFSPASPRCQAVLDWELSTVGDPIADLAYNCLVYYLPPQFPQVPGFAGVALPEGVPTEEEYVKAYLRRTGRGEVLNWHFYLSFSFFRIAAILQVYIRNTHTHTFTHTHTHIHTHTHTHTHESSSSAREGLSEKRKKKEREARRDGRSHELPLLLSLLYSFFVLFFY
jgi:aminoglycoside phosphotransferase (APT) family kinase protein